MSKLSAEQLQAKYGDMLAGPPWGDFKTAYLLHQALQSRRPAVPVSVAAVRTWIGKYRIASGGYSINTAQELQDQYGSCLLPLAREHATAFKLCKALRERSPPLYVADGVAKRWLEKYGPHGALKYIDNAGHVESQYGELIREHSEAKCMEADALAKWLLNEHSVRVNVGICQNRLELITSIDVAYCC